jgi:hypothetical protein
MAESLIFPFTRIGFMCADSRTGCGSIERKGVRLRSISIPLAVALFACSNGAPGGTTNPPPPDVGGGTFRSCRGRPFTPGSTEKWKRVKSEGIVLLGPPVHSGQDVIARPGDAPILPGRFTYGLVSKDLEGESVRVWIDDCKAWRSLGELVTDGEGRVFAEAPKDFGVGVYQVHFEVAGDVSSTTSFLWVLPAGTHLVAMNFDGTLNRSEYEVFLQILDGSFRPPAIAGAADLTHAHATIGHVVLYLTARPYWLGEKTREWLAAEHLADGPLHLAEHTAQAIPAEAGVGDYKKAYLKSLIDAGYAIDFAYGNMPMDIYAYLGAGSPPENVFIIGDHGGERGTNAVGTEWTARVSAVAALPPVQQPYSTFSPSK